MSGTEKTKTPPNQPSGAMIQANPKDLAEVLRENFKPEVKTIERGDDKKTDVIVVPEGFKVESLKKHLDENRLYPERRTGTVTTTRIKSFIDVVNRFKNEDSVVFADVKVEDKRIEANLTAVFDYHPKNDDVQDADNLGHRATFGFPISKAFKNWLEKNTQAMSQIEFAYFLEKRLHDMSAPTEEDKAMIEGLKPKFADPINILELSRDLEIYSNEAFISRNKLSSGETEIKFSAQHVDGNGKPISIPDFFVINVPIFEGGSRQRVLSQLRYRKDGNVLVWFYELYNIDEMLLEAFDKATAEVEAAVALPLYFGKAEK